MAFVFTAITAEVVTFAAVATAVAELGMAMQVIGAVTHNKDISKVGGFLSLAGGIASIGSMAFSAATTAADVGAAATGTGDAAFDSWAADQGAAEYAAGGVNGTEAFGGSAPSWAGADGTALSSGTGTEGLLSDSAQFDQGGSIPGSSPTPESVGAENGNAPVNNAAMEPSQPATAPPPATTQQAPTVPSDQPNVTGKPTAAPNGSEEFVSNHPYAAGDPMVTGISPPPATDSASIAKWWAKQTDTTKNTILQMGGKALGGMFEGWTQEQKLALEREKFNLEQQKYNTSVANSNAQPTVNRNPPAGGLLNTNRGG